jgi:hypothetical protein
LDPEIGSEMGSEYDTELDTKLDTELDTELDAELDSELDSKYDSDPNNDCEAGSEIGSEIGSEMGSPVLDWLFKLCCLFWTTRTTTGDTAKLQIVYFSRVLGIQRSTLAYRTAYHYTPFLAGLTWIGRLIMLEYALLVQTRNQLRRVQRIQRKYLCRGNAYPIGWLIEAMAYARMIAKKEGGCTNIS